MLAKTIDFNYYKSSSKSECDLISEIFSKNAKKQGLNKIDIKRICNNAIKEVRKK